jgi:hypothetical protein
MDCTDVGIVQARDSRAFGRPVPGKLRTVVVRAGTNPVVRWTMVDERGCAVDLTPCALDAPPTDPPGPAKVVPVFLRIAENTLLGFDPDFVGRCVDPTGGVVECALDLRQVGGPGIYVAEFAVLGEDLTTVILTNPFTLLVERGLFGGDPTGIPTLAEIRLRLRDYPQYNELLGDFAWDDAEIVQALQEPIDYWNADLPDVGIYYTTQTFPAQYRHWWIRGTVASLFRLAAEHQRRNQFDYSSGGIQVQDSARGQDYLQAAETAWAEFKAWVRSRKIVLNQELCWGIEGSGYG